MIRLIAVAGFALAVATSAQGMTPAPIPQPDGIVTQVAFGCGPGRTLVNGVCGQNHHPADPPRDAQVCAMERRRLCSVPVTATKQLASDPSQTGRQLITLDVTSVVSRAVDWAHKKAPVRPGALSCG